MSFILLSSCSFTHLQYGSTEGRVGGLGDLVMCMVSSRQKVDTWRVVSKSSKMILATSCMAARDTV